MLFTFVLSRFISHCWYSEISTRLYTLLRVWWHTDFHSDAIKFARCFDVHVTHRSENSRGDLSICLLWQSNFLAFSIERFRFYFFVAWQWERSTGTHIRRSLTRKTGASMPHTNDTPEDAVVGQVHWKLFALLTIFANDLFAVFRRGKVSLCLFLWTVVTLLLKIYRVSDDATIRASVCSLHFILTDIETCISPLESSLYYHWESNYCTAFQTTSQLFSKELIDHSLQWWYEIL